MNFRYGFLKGNFSQEKLTDPKNGLSKTFPHYNFVVNVNNQNYNANINIQSRDPNSPDLKVFYTENPQQDILNLDPFLAVAQLPCGVYLNPQHQYRLDYLRGKYFDLNKLVVLDQPGVEEKQLLFNLINKHIQLAKENNYDVCLWGQLYNDKRFFRSKKGIHDIHMNQGNLTGLENGVWQDGAFAILNGSEIKFLCFLTFAAQCMETDDQGNCLP